MTNDLEKINNIILDTQAEIASLHKLIEEKTLRRSGLYVRLDTLYLQARKIAEGKQ